MVCSVVGMLYGEICVVGRVVAGVGAIVFLGRVEWK